MENTLLFVLIFLPFAAAGLCWLVPSGAVRRGVVLVTAALLAAASLGLFGRGAFAATPESLLGLPLNGLITLADFALLLVILGIGLKRKNRWITILTLLQLVPLAIFELTLPEHGPIAPALVIDGLSLIMILVISIVGSLICVFALPYMEAHEQHLHLRSSRQGRFFFFLVLFLGAMNGLVAANNILWAYFFWELTTLCSFALIGHDGGEEATANAVRALVMNLFGGVALVCGIIFLYGAAKTLSIQDVVQAGSLGTMAFVAFALIALAGFTKAAQLPFQSWLLGAMVAPTPVSALLHSSTMVKAGVYIVLRFAPAFAGSAFADCLAVAGGFTFCVATGLALGQSNGKRILAYSTIGNLGLIMACAGIGTPAALAAGMLFIVFHAVSKGLLFLCVGAIEQTIGSRDIEDMRGLYDRMPRTAVITVIGIVTMLLPPFGVLMAKWMAIEAAADNLPVVVLIAMGSALGVVVWGRWAGILMSSSRTKKAWPEAQPALLRWPLAVLAGGAVVLSFLLPAVYASLVAPMLKGPIAGSAGSLASGLAAYLIYPLFLVLAAGFLYAVIAARQARAAVDTVYLAGAQAGPPESPAFTGPMDQPVVVSAGNYYLPSIFGEERLTFPLNVIAVALIIIMAGGALI